MPLRAKKWSLYVLVCPVEDIVRYVGITTKPIKKRLSEHLVDKKSNPYKRNWIESLKRRNNRPKIKSIKTDLSEEEACKLEISLIKKYRLKNKKKLTNLHPGGNLPPTYKGKNSPRAKRRKYKVWNKDEEHYFDYIFEAVDRLKISSSSIQKGLRGVYKTTKGYNLCYVDKLADWEAPIDERFGTRPFKVWRADSKKEFIFSSQSEASKKLNLHSANISSILRKKRYSSNGYFACYLDELERWEAPNIVCGEGHPHSACKTFIIWGNKKKYKFDYISSAVNTLRINRRNLVAVLSGKEYSHKGFYACYLDKIRSWVPPKIRKKHRDKIFNAPIKIWNETSKEEYTFSNLDEAMSILDIKRYHIKNVLLGFTKMHKGYKAIPIKLIHNTKV